jgi:ferredoxin
MTVTNDEVGVRPRIATVDGLDRVIERLRSLGYRVVGPKLSRGAITLGEVSGVADLPRGWHDEQGPGTYRLNHESDDELFGYAVGPHAAKTYLHPATWTLFRAHGSVDEIEATDPGQVEPLALMLRPCEVAAIEVQDKIFLGSPYSDPVYRAFRDAAFIVAVNCGVPAANCFCTSMGTGPRCESGFDLAITELASRAGSRLMFEAGSGKGVSLIDSLDLPEASDDDIASAMTLFVEAVESIDKVLDVNGLAALLMKNPDSPQWEAVAERCLTCLNCTMVCPTCFCTTVDDSLDLSGTEAERTRLWDSCFALSFSYIHGGSVRKSASSRYRQWMTHKLASWIDQFGTRGCVGCGRCITWCPAGIDITAEAAAMRERHGSDSETGANA